MLKLLLGFGLGAGGMYWFLERPGQPPAKKIIRYNDKLRSAMRDELKRLHSMDEALKGSGQSMPPRLVKHRNALDSELTTVDAQFKRMVDQFGSLTDKALLTAKKII